MIARAMHPAGQAHARSDVAGPQFTAGVSAILVHHGVLNGEVLAIANSEWRVGTPWFPPPFTKGETRFATRLLQHLKLRDGHPPGGLRRFAPGQRPRGARGAGTRRIARKERCRFRRLAPGGFRLGGAHVPWSGALAPKGLRGMATR